MESDRYNMQIKEINNNDFYGKMYKKEENYFLRQISSQMLRHKKIAQI